MLLRIENSRGSTYDLKHLGSSIQAEVLNGQYGSRIRTGGITYTVPRGGRMVFGLEPWSEILPINMGLDLGSEEVARRILVNAGNAYLIPDPDGEARCQRALVSMLEKGNHAR